MIRLIINGATHEIDADPQTPLLWVIRDRLDLTGTKYGCGIAACGACTVLVDGAQTRSCSMPIGAVDGSRITTIESVAESGWEPVQQAWIEKQVPQCGYCQSGMIMASIDLLTRHPNPSREQIRESVSNLCRCGTYQRVEDAILLAADKLAQSRRQAGAEEKQRLEVKKIWRKKGKVRG
jgi:isoquinoline 1-oxidoreductase subunit alpha